MNELWIVRFVRKDGKPDEEYYYRSLAEAEHHKNLFLDDTLSDHVPGRHLLSRKQALFAEH